MDNVSVLQLGKEDWREVYNIPSYAKWTYVKTLEDVPKRPYCLVFLDRVPTKDELKLLRKCTKAYCLYITTTVPIKGEFMEFCISKLANKINEKDIQTFLDNELKYFFAKSYGEKFRNTNLDIALDFKGRVEWHGNCGIELEGDFGEEYSQLMFWRNNIPIAKGQTIEFWMEYEKESGVEIKIVITQFQPGSLSNVIKKWEFDEEQFKHTISVVNDESAGPICVSVHAKGEGKFKIIALHDRFSRKRHGHFIPGGMRKVSSKREEVFFYFDPGDMKPPLNVYFSGYKTKEGFEGYFLMRNMNAPFLLVSESRLEGGGFYMGSEEYESLITNAILEYIDDLDFKPSDVIMSGLSMGTYGALYYSCDVTPHALILGKPLANIGDVALNEKLKRPGGFPTSLDVVKNVFGDANKENAYRLNDKFWDKFNDTDWNNTKFIMSYMIEDDYDSNAYENVISHLKSGGVKVYGKGVHGRHNDNTGAIVGWFSSQFEKILREDFGRDI
ncbi:MAG: accessory Sec system protein Asp2 [Lachnospiraceae bacterium]|nr:accessory Sec system protein Asp2 [Lachnospiraceae bacterium]